VSLSQAAVPLSGEGDLGLGVLLPHLASVIVEKVRVGGDLVRAWVRARADGAACPGCGRWCTKVHHSYTRTLADTGIGGRRVLIHLVVRLLRCGAGCGTATFAEQPAGLASRYTRRTPLLERELTEVARALAGRAGSRLASAVLAVQVSRHALIRLVMSLPDPPAGPVRVLGADDFSLRRGHSYATLLVDMETGRPVDVLPDREAATLQAWLEAHPGTEVICRDRGTAYAQAARDGAPAAVQVADRWHIWDDLGDHVVKAVARHKDCLAGTACRHQDPDPAQGQEQAPEVMTAADLEAVIRDRHQQVQQLRTAGQTQDQAAAALGLTRQVTGRYWRAASPAALLPARATSALDRWKPRLHQRAAAGITSARALHEEITALGYAGSYSTTYAYASMFALAAPPRPPAPPRHRQAARWILTRPGRLGHDDQAQLDAIHARCPQLDALTRHVAGFAKILTQRLGGDQLDAWLAAVDADDQPGLHSFTTGIRQDYDAVRNAVTLTWNSGPVEGRNTTVKLLKRQMYGRASFRLLRKRILTC
jgi:transposase